MPRIDSAAALPSTLSTASSAAPSDAWWRPITSGLATGQIDVDPTSATLTELIRLAALASALPPQSPLLAERIGVPCLPGSHRIRLYFDDDAARNRASLDANAPISAAAKRACDALAQMLTNTQADIRLQDNQSPAARVLGQYSRALERSRRAQTAASFMHMVQVTGEALHRHCSARLSPVRAQIAQTPTDCMLQWITALDSAKSDAQHRAQNTASDLSTDADWLAQTDAAARRRWMQHDLTLPSVQAYFDHMQTECDARGATSLAEVARTIAATLPSPQQAIKFATRLNDNVMGRVFETQLIAQLIASPAPGTLACSQNLAVALHDFFMQLSSTVKTMLVKDLSLTLATKPRFWYDRLPALLQFISAVPGEPKKQALLAWLSQPVESSYASMGVTLLACQISLRLKYKAGASAPWMWPSDLNYAQVVQPSARRLNNMHAPLLRAEGGILLLHQRAVFSDASMRPGIRAALQHRPNLDTPSPATKRMLDHGLPYVSGQSGSTNMLLYQAHFFRQRGIELDSKQLLLGATMLLSAGHSLHEVLWVGHQLDRTLDLGLGLSTAAPEEFISDYDRFIALFDGADRQALEQAVAVAWNDTIAQVRAAVP